MQHLNRHTDNGTHELEILEKKKNELEKIRMKISIENLNMKVHEGLEFMIEVLYTSTENPQDFFTLGNTQLIKVGKDNYIRFEEEIEVHFLFERMQFIRLIIYSSDNNTSELTVNLVKVMTSNFTTLRFPVDLLKGESVLYTGANEKGNKQVVLLEFKRITEGLDKLYPNFLLEFNFNSNSMQANRMKYVMLVKTIDDDVKLIRESNEMSGKNPFCFAISEVNSKDLFSMKGILFYVFEFYQNDVYFGQIILEKGDMDKILTSDVPVNFNVLRGRQVFTNCKKQTPKNSSVLLISLKGSSNSTQSHRKMASTSTSRLGVQALDNESSNQKSKVITKAVSNKKLNTLNESSEKENNLLFTPLSAKGKDVGKSIFNQKNKLTSSLSLSNSKKNALFGNSIYEEQDTEKVVGTSEIYYFEKKRKMLHDYFIKDMRILFSIAIDFTSSNLDPNNPESLHTKFLEHNQYAKSINICGKILNEYANDKVYPVYGFGGVPENSNSVSHCFNINGKKDPNISGIDEVISTYFNCLSTVKFVGPTYFKFILKSMLDSVKRKLSSESFNYHVFLILTDGRVDDMPETIDLIIELSKMPISIIIAGVGNADFGKMHTLG